MSALLNKLSFFKKKEFWLSLLLLLAMFFAFYFLFFKVVLPLYTGHGKSTEVPDVVRLHIDEATSKLTDAGLRVEVTDSLYDPKMKPRSVIAQVPMAHEQVKPGRPVFLTLNKVVPPMVSIPSDVVKTSVYQAKLRLESWKLGVASIKSVPSEFKDLVLRLEYEGKEIKEGDKLPQGSQIILVVGKGTGKDKIAVPCLDGKTIAEAISECHNSGLNFDLQFKPEAKDEKGTVINQYPKCSEDDSLAIGSEMTIIIAGKEPEEVEEYIPDGSK